MGSTYEVANRLTGAQSFISLDVCRGCWPLQLPRHQVHWAQGQEQPISQLIHKDVAFVRGAQQVISVNICSEGRSARIFEYSATFDFRFSIFDFWTTDFLDISRFLTDFQVISLSLKTALKRAGIFAKKKAWTVKSAGIFAKKAWNLKIVDGDWYNLYF